MCDHCHNNSGILYLLRKFFHKDKILCLACTNIFQNIGWKLIVRVK